MAQLKCPSCKNINTRVIDGGRYKSKGYTRRYECSICGYRFNSIEEYVSDPFMYRKMQRKKEPKKDYRVIAFAERVKEQLDASMDELDMYNYNDGLLYAIEIVDRELENEN